MLLLSKLERHQHGDICICPCMCLLARLSLQPLVLAAAGGEGCLAACESRVCISSPFLEEIVSAVVLWGS